MGGPRTAPPETGDAARPLRLPTLEGSEFRLDAHCGRVVLVSFLRHAG
jgi:hypothetical protein